MPQVKDRPYSCTDASVADTLTSHDRSFTIDANAVYNEDECRAQMVVRPVLRAVSHHYTSRQHR